MRKTNCAIINLDLSPLQRRSLGQIIQQLSEDYSTCLKYLGFRRKSGWHRCDAQPDLCYCGARLPNRIHVK